MDPARISSLELMIDVIKQHTPQTIWVGAPLESFRRVANTNRGDIGEEFIRRFLSLHGISASERGSRVSRSDMQIAGQSFEIKTASEDSSGSFQFNHVRLDRRYDYLLCLGVRPASIMFNAWGKGEVSEGRAGTLVRMAEGQSVTFKLTKRPDSMLQIEQLPDWIRTNIRNT
jgi:hypothetical protein